MQYSQQNPHPDLKYVETKGDVVWFQCQKCHNNPDGSQHACKKQDNGNGKEKEKQTKQEFTLEAVLKKLESVGIKVNLNELMNQK
jgi:hypothetical protein